MCINNAADKATAPTIKHPRVFPWEFSRRYLRQPTTDKHQIVYDFHAIRWYTFPAHVISYPMGMEMEMEIVLTPPRAHDPNFLAKKANEWKSKQTQRKSTFVSFFYTIWK